ncbi:MAG: type II CRISPR-associated endonuclease Cas1 [Bacteroidaceae bacterium]|nr:type II CRISPR-associated endonuclease Cas1 [Bacteroidaceae bacterium]
MSWRIVYFSKPAKLKIESSQLKYIPDEGDSLTIPIEDISVILLESNQILLTSALISKCCQNNILIFSCDDKHLPCGIFTPFQQHSRVSQISNLQIKSSEPLKKRLWQQIIKSKIYNQSMVLKLFNLDNANLLVKISENVKSGDSDNSEAYSAKIYWQSLFGEFTRQEDNKINSSLNYGYAILRGAIARAISSAGLMPSFGIYHSNDLNAFNLADDIIEPFRPFVDFKVYSMFKEENNFKEQTLTTKDKFMLTGILLDKCIYDSETTSILNAIELTVNSFVLSLKTNANCLNLLEFNIENR